MTPEEIAATRAQLEEATVDVLEQLRASSEWRALYLESRAERKGVYPATVAKEIDECRSTIEWVNKLLGDQP